MSNLNTVDLILIVLFVIGGIQGAFKGFIEELGEKFGFVFGFMSSIMFTKSAVGLVLKQIDLPVWAATGLTYVVLFLIGYLLIKAISSIISNIFDSSTANLIDGILGFLLGLFEMMIVCALLIEILNHQSFFDIAQYTNGSVLNNKILSQVYKLLTSVAKEVF